MRSLLLVALGLCCATAFAKGDEDELLKKEEGRIAALLRDMVAKRSCGTRSRMSSSQKNAILKIHNDKRKIAKAKRMPDLRWSSDLADRAQQIADQNAYEGCRMKHGLTTDCSGGSIGQNLYIYGYSGAVDPSTFDVTQAATSWYDEVKDYSYGRLNTKSSHFYKIGHYTQMMWAATTEVGCGISNVCRSGGYNRVIIACDYRQSGNFNGQYPFECPTDTEFDDGVCEEDSGWFFWRKRELRAEILREVERELAEEKDVIQENGDSALPQNK